MRRVTIWKVSGRSYSAFFEKYVICCNGKKLVYMKRWHWRIPKRRVTIWKVSGPSHSVFFVSIRYCALTQIMENAIEIQVPFVEQVSFMPSRTTSSSTPKSMHVHILAIISYPKTRSSTL